MSPLDEDSLFSVAYNRVTWKNHKARHKLQKAKYPSKNLSQLSGAQLLKFGFSQDEVQTIHDNYLQIAEEELEKARQNNVGIIFKGDRYYPPLLAEIYDPPDYLYVVGKREILLGKTIAVIGSRQGRAYAHRVLEFLLPDLVCHDITIVSGMAYGIDSMAHRITIAGGGKTIGVNAGGLLHPYPTGNRNLINKIVAEGCMISEIPLDVVPRPFCFPIRNRIIAGISRSILVVEAALQSGSLITARLGLEQNRDIFAVPGRIDSPLSKGTHFLIQQGAKLIANSEDILEEYGIKKKGQPADIRKKLHKKEVQVLDLMADNELKSIDYFLNNLDFSVSEIISLLMSLVLKKVVIEESGGYRRIE
jgi:DNA processing protein